MGHELRRFPRIAVDQPGVVEIYPAGEEPQAPQTLDVVVSSISPHGAGVQLQALEAIPPSARVTLHLVIDGSLLELPGRVVWSAGKRAGIRLRLASAPAPIKQAYGAWIVPRTNEAIARSRRAETSR